MTDRKRAGLGLTAVMCAVLLMADIGLAQTKEPLKPSKKDKCPVCGMFVYKYPDWLAEIVFKDDTVVFFDGAKDMFKYYYDVRKYGAGKSATDIAAVYVMEYYDMRLIDARKAFFVVGSDVYGPMGRELIPFATREDAATFMQDHKGQRILRFDNVTSDLIEDLD